MNNKYLIYTAKLLSMLFAPFYFPILAIIILFMFSYMKLMPLNYKLMILIFVYFFTIALPLIGIWIFRRLNGIHRHQLTRREMRTVPYFIFIFSCGFCIFLMMKLHIPHFMISVIFGALIVQQVCAFINNWIRISTHSAAAGAVSGALLAFAFIFHFNPTLWFCLSLLLGGMVGTSRLVLRQHSLKEVNLGLLIVLLCGFSSILFM